MEKKNESGPSGIFKTKPRGFGRYQTKGAAPPWADIRTHDTWISQSAFEAELRVHCSTKLSYGPV